MISAVLDANTVISGTIVTLGPSARILDAARAERFVLITSRPILTEVFRTLGRPRVRRKYPVGPAEMERLRSLLEHDALVTPISQQIHGVATHPEDDLILATAASAQANYLVTGDSKLQKLGVYEGVKIVSPREFLQLLEEQSP